MYYIIIIWMLLIFWYLCVIISPNCLNNVSKEYVNKNIIEEKQIIGKIYLNKNAFPKLKSMAITFIILLNMNIVDTIIVVILHMNSFDTTMINNFEIVYLIVFMVIATVPIIFANLKK